MSDILLTLTRMLTKGDHARHSRGVHRHIQRGLWNVVGSDPLAIPSRGESRKSIRQGRLLTRPNCFRSCLCPSEPREYHYRRQL